MSKSLFYLSLVLLLTFSGCAFIKQAKADFDLGKSTPIAEGEANPEDEAASLVGIISGLPFVGPYAGTVGTVLAGFFAWRRGRRLRKGLPANPKPATGFIGNAVGLEALVQNLSSLVTGVFEAGGEGSALKRSWKVGLASTLGLATVALAVPSVRDFVLSNPAMSALIVASSSLFGGLEKILSKVQPTNPTS